MLDKLETAIETKNQDPEDDWDVCFSHFRAYFKRGQSKVTELTEKHISRGYVDVSDRKISMILKVKGT